MYPVSSSPASAQSSPVARLEEEVIKRSAFLYGLQHSRRSVQDVQAAIAAVVAAAAGTDGDGVPRRVSSDCVLAGVFYFTAQPPSPDMPWRPVYKTLSMLCVFTSVAACERAVQVLGAAADLGSGGEAHRTAVPPMSTTAFTSGASTPHVLLRRAVDAVWLSPSDVHTALMTFLPSRQLAEMVLLQRQRATHGVPAGDARLAAAPPVSPDGDPAELALLAPPPRLAGSVPRLFAALLSPQSLYQVDWAAARDAVRRGDGVVVAELLVLSPYVGSLRGGLRGWEERRDGAVAHDRRGDAAEATTTANRGSADTARFADARAGRRHPPADLPLTLQEQDYRRRYGVPFSGAHQDAGGGAALTLVRRCLYEGGQLVGRGVRWAARSVRSSHGDDEVTLTAPLVPPPVAGGAGGTPGRRFDHQAEEPPRQRHRSEGGSSVGGSAPPARQRGTAIVYPRYNAVGTALSWMPGFHHFGHLFVTSVTVLRPEGASAQNKAAPRRRPREEEADVLGGWSRDPHAEAAPRAVPAPALSAASDLPPPQPFTPPATTPSQTSSAWRGADAPQPPSSRSPLLPTPPPAQPAFMPEDPATSPFLGLHVNGETEGVPRYSGGIAVTNVRSPALGAEEDVYTGSSFVAHLQRRRLLGRSHASFADALRMQAQEARGRESGEGVERRGRPASPSRPVPGILKKSVRSSETTERDSSEASAATRASQRVVSFDLPSDASL